MGWESMSDLKPCPKCKSTKDPLRESDGYDRCLTCKDCGYFTGWKYVYPDASEIWNEERV